MQEIQELRNSITPFLDSTTDRFFGLDFFDNGATII